MPKIMHTLIVKMFRDIHQCVWIHDNKIYWMLYLLLSEYQVELLTPSGSQDELTLIY